MGRRAYLNRLALGRSPYEAPEPPAGYPGEHGISTHRRISPLNADGYVQHYDERGHPVNQESKSFGRDLRRAKNDILSTMGIVVSEDANRGRNEQQRIDAIVAENDYGLVMVTLDQISVFLGSWWTTSLIGRIQTFRSYAHVPITGIINQERASLGTFGFYFAGIPAWAMSTCLSICRHHPLERLISTFQNFFPNDDTGSKLVRASFTIVHSATRGALLVLAMQTYMYSLLQSLHLIPPASMPSIGSFMPFGEFTSMLLPSFPQDLSLCSLSNFAWNILKTPSLFYIYVYLRPVIEVRLYRLIRRRLPKPNLTDDLSIKVAFENDLVDWMVPTLGRRAAEEKQRSKLSLMEDLSYELSTLRQWLSSKIPFRSCWASLVHTAESQQQSETPQPQGQPTYRSLDPEEQHRRLRSAQWHPADQVMSIHGSDARSTGSHSTLSNEEHQAPNADNMDLLRRARNLTLSTRTSSPGPDTHRHEAITVNESRRQSHPDTLHSRSRSPASSQSSPRVRAQLVQESDVVAMQLELESRHTHDRNAIRDSDANSQNADAGPAGRNSISDLLDTILSDQGGHITILDSEATHSVVDRPAAVSPGVGETVTATASGHQPNGIPTVQNAAASSLESTVSGPINNLSDVADELAVDDANNQLPNRNDVDDDDDNAAADADSEFTPHLADSAARQNSTSDTAATTAFIPSHRVTILSSLPVDSLASHLAAMITAALFAPLESFYLRSLARSYLASKGAPIVLRSDVYPLGSLGGGRSRSDTFAYLSKLALMMGIQAAVNASVWGIISGTAIRIGRKWCGWGAF